MNEQNAVECKETESGEMQTVVSSYVAPNLIRQERLDVHYSADSYTEYQYGEEVDRTSSPDTDEKINVDDEDKDELVIADDDVSERNEVSIEEKEEETEDKDRKSDSTEREESGEPSWHPHVYGKPPKKPTPHTIEYILGLSKNGDVSKEEPKRVVSQLMNVKRNFDKKTFSYQEKSTQVQNLSDKKFSLSVHKNKLQEQLLQRGVRTNESEYDKVIAFKSEEQPLNLSVPKSKDTPGWSSGVDEDKFSKDKQQMKRKKSTEDVRSPLGGEGSMTSEEGEEIGRRKKARTTFTGRQIFELEKLFEVKKYLSSGERADMAKLLNVTETQRSSIIIALLDTIIQEKEGIDILDRRYLD
ncbi:unnamed protein product, partial [Brenthis ino]